jgi:hypothetical protein
MTGRNDTFLPQGGTKGNGQIACKHALFACGFAGGGMPQNITLPAPAFVLAQIVANEGPVDDDNQLGRPYFRHVPGGCSQWSLIYTRDGAGLFEYPEWTHRTGRGEAVLLRPGTPLFFRRPDDAPVWNQMWAQFHPRPHWYAWLD